MIQFIGGLPHCKRCGYEVESGRDTCPRCQFSPKLKGLKVALAMLMAVVVLMTAVMVLPVFSFLFVQLAGAAFVLALLTFTMSFLATPYRFASPFLWL